MGLALVTSCRPCNTEVSYYHSKLFQILRFSNIILDDVDLKWYMVHHIQSKYLNLYCSPGRGAIHITPSLTTLNSVVAAYPCPWRNLWYTMNLWYTDIISSSDKDYGKYNMLIIMMLLNVWFELSNFFSFSSINLVMNV